MKRLVILCDGTWNSADAEHTTNVVKTWKALAETDADGNRQVPWYDPGVGCDGSWLRRAFDGATGTGLSKNIRQAYTWLLKHYAPGDKLYLFGFSRGAYTVRSLAGMIRNCGIIRRPAFEKDAKLVEKAFKLYRSHAQGDHPNGENAMAFRRAHADEANILFIGVWDTVGALGNPLWTNSLASRKNKFHDTSLSRIVQNAYHALAIDEKRLNFNACLWEQQQSHRTTQVLEQVWFSGVHADVGGGYADATFSDIPLAWMMEKAKSCGLAFTDPPPTPQPLWGKNPHESWKGFYKAIPAHSRPVRLNGTTNDTIHESASEKFFREATYRPANLIPPLG
ncbi:DUF2235 domain-containing protein [Pseudodesulfovibrio alkaliphilus]|nr:DUF2235 domain-containing protein [Pseudodesulfovibrio alkaliphilus]